MIIAPNAWLRDLNLTTRRTRTLERLFVNSDHLMGTRENGYHWTDFGAPLTSSDS